jgi:hypothetical protein
MHMTLYVHCVRLSPAWRVTINQLTNQMICRYIYVQRSRASIHAYNHITAVNDHQRLLFGCLLLNTVLVSFDTCLAVFDLIHHNGMRC